MIRYGCITCRRDTEHRRERHHSGESLFRCQHCGTWTLAQPTRARKPLRKNPAGFEKEILVYGLPKGETERYTEQLLSSKCKTLADVEKIKKTAAKDGWHSFRVTYFDGEAPDFTKTLRKNPSSRTEIARATKLADDFSGHRPNKISRVRLPRAGSVRLAVGTVTAIQYQARRDGETNEYRHRFAQGSRPQLTVTPDGKRLELLGGAFRFTERGIVDKRSRN